MRHKAARLAFPQVKRLFDLAEENDRDYLIIACFALGGLSRGETVGSTDRRRIWSITDYTHTKSASEHREREDHVKRLQRGEKVIHLKDGIKLSLVAKGTRVEKTLPKDPLPGLKVEDIRDSKIHIKGKRGIEREWVPPPPIYARFKKYIKERNLISGSVFPIGSDGVRKLITVRYGKLAGLPELTPGMLTDFYNRSTHFMPDILARLSLEFTPDYVGQLIEEDENEQVEFKRELSNSLKISMGLASLANLRGGVMLIGVENSKYVVGVNENELPKIEETIRSISIEYCRPRIPLSVQSVPINGKQVVVIAVREGGDKPYWIKDHGPFIREGNRNRIMTREEVEHEFEQKFYLTSRK
jgi:hypothetical protein